VSGLSEPATQAESQREYARRRQERMLEAARRLRWQRRVSNLRLAVFALVVAHDRIIRGRERADRAVGFYERGIERLEARWAGRGETGERFRDPEHPYAEDLDLFGAGSLFELLCAARTRAGEDALADWLLSPADPAVVRRRQAAVAELRPRLQLREDLAVLGEGVRAGLHPEALRHWGEAPAQLPKGALRWLAALLPVVSIACIAGWWLDRWGPAPAELALLTQAIFALVLRPRVQRVVRSAELPGRDLALLASLLERVEQERFEAPRLVELRAALETGGVAPSRHTGALRLRIDLLDARRNQLFAPLGALLLWTTQLAFALERWRERCGPALATWLEALGELEALASLAAHAYENPDHTFPELDEGGDVFAAEALGHPLLPADTCVRNDLTLGGPLRVLVVSGSNMSGKSTLLRTVGVNAVLALAGCVTRSRRLRLAPFRVAASIRVQDSLRQGRSRFYAEIARLRRVMELADEGGPVLFLIDEILHGTNSHDRGVGAAALMRGLVERGAVGLVTTHDLALARVADELAPRAGNVHFEDHLEDGEIAFDYRMRPGVVTRSNALELMRAVGLDV
jgi:hypothetical protein